MLLGNTKFQKYKIPFEQCCPEAEHIRKVLLQAVRTKEYTPLKASHIRVITCNVGRHTKTAGAKVTFFREVTMVHITSAKTMR